MAQQIHATNVCLPLWRAQRNSRVFDTTRPKKNCRDRTRYGTGTVAGEETAQSAVANQPTGAPLSALFRPTTLPQGVYRSAPPMSYWSTKTRLRKQYAAEAAASEMLLELGPVVRSVVPPQSELDARGFPYPPVSEMKVLGVYLDSRMALDEHFQMLSHKAQLRQGILARAAVASWDLDALVLKVTHDALITGLLRYALVLTGSGLPDDLLNKIDSWGVNVASRRILGLPLITRIEALRFLAGTRSIRNLYAQLRGKFPHTLLLRHDSGIQLRLHRGLCAIY